MCKFLALSEMPLPQQKPTRVLYMRWPPIDGGHKISFDKAVTTMAKTGRDIQVAYRETGIGGLAKSWEPFKG